MDEFDIAGGAPAGRRADAKREQILAAAAAEFQERGFEGASMDRVSARAGASKRTVYRYFDGKTALFRTLVARHWAQFAESLDVVYDPNVEMRDQLVALGRAAGRIFASPERMAATRMIMSEMLRDPDLAGESQKKTDYLDSFEAMLRAAETDGRLSLDDPRSAAEEFVALLKAKAFWPVMLGAPVVDEVEMARIVGRSADMILSRYAPRGADF